MIFLVLNSPLQLLPFTRNLIFLLTSPDHPRLFIRPLEKRKKKNCLPFPSLFLVNANCKAGESKSQNHEW